MGPTCQGHLPSPAAPCLCFWPRARPPPLPHGPPPELVEPEAPTTDPLCARADPDPARAAAASDSNSFSTGIRQPNPCWARLPRPRTRTPRRPRGPLNSAAAPPWSPNPSKPPTPPAPRTLASATPSPPHRSSAPPPQELAPPRPRCSEVSHQGEHRCRLFFPSPSRSYAHACVRRLYFATAHRRAISPPHSARVEATIEFLASRATFPCKNPSRIMPGA